MTTELKELAQQLADAKQRRVELNAQADAAKALAQEANAKAIEAATQVFVLQRQLQEAANEAFRQYLKDTVGVDPFAQTDEVQG